MDKSNPTSHQQLKAALERQQHELLFQLDDGEKTGTGQAIIGAESEASPADNASARTLSEVAVEITEHKTIQLQSVRHALTKFDDGRYGVCESCGEPIGLSRLSARPEARFCISCQTNREKSEKLY